MVTYLNSRDIVELGVNWSECIKQIERTCFLLEGNDYSQPIKPYLHFNNSSNRIIAMPGFVGGEHSCAGIKWIASFPDNIKIGKPRANSITILNDVNTGEPYCIINTSLISVIRTASLSGLMIQKYLTTIKPDVKIDIGVIGLGPIGQYHIKMCQELFGDWIGKTWVFDLSNSKVNSPHGEIGYCDKWQDVYRNADILMTCTVADFRYIDLKPKASSLHLNISLRDYKENTYAYFKNAIIVDDWEEVCRKNTDIEMFSIKHGLKKKDTYSIVDIVCKDKLKSFNGNDPIFFNPMGMAVFDIAIASYYHLLSGKMKVGLVLE